MRSFIGRFLVFFYVITLPTFFGLYVASMVKSYPKYDALWFEGGATEFGPLSFYVLSAIYVIPPVVTLCQYLITGYSAFLSRVFGICVWLSPLPIGAAIVADVGKTKFPLAIVWFTDKLVFWSFIVWVVCVAYRVYRLHSNVSREADQHERNQENARRLREIALRHQVGPDAVSELFARICALSAARNETQEKILTQHLPQHVRLLSGMRFSVGDYWLLADNSVGCENLLRAGAFDDLARNSQLCLKAGSLNRYFEWLREYQVHRFCDNALVYLFANRSYGLTQLPLDQAILECRIGEFSSVEEYLAFKKAPGAYFGYSDKQRYEKELERITHPILLEMFEHGGVYRARVLQILNKANPAMATTSSIPIAEPTPEVSPPPPALTVELVSISRGGRVIFRDMPLHNLSAMVLQGQVLPTDHYWCSGMAGWSLVSAYRSVDAPRQVAREGVNWGEVFADFFLSWLLYVLGGVFIAGLLGYGNGGMSGVGSAIGGFLGFIILVRPVTFVFRTLFRLVIGKRGMELFR
jgi:hypothetical protein